MKKNFRQSLKKNKFIQAFSSIRITVACLFLLFFLTFFGTLAQVEHGLYNAQTRYFNSLVFLLFGFLPFPGARLVLWVLFINLLSVSISRFVYRWSHIGILIIHFGLLSYFISAFVTFHCVEESNVSLLENEGTNVSSGYHQWELSIWTEPGTVKKVSAFNAKEFNPGRTLQLENFNLTVTVQSYYPNSEAYAKGPNSKRQFINDSGIQSLAEIPIDIAPEKNFPGGIFEIQSKNGTLQEVLLYGGESKPTQLEINGKQYFVQLRRKRYEMPFTLILTEFTKTVHPNTEIAKTYQSLVEIRNQNISREVLISMNEPLRYKNFTLYQASYGIDALGRELSTLAVVKNSGRLLPYFSSLITFFGLAVHFLMIAFNVKLKTNNS